LKLFPLLVLAVWLFPAKLLASCSPDMMLLGQVSYTNKALSIWRIDGKNPYTANNVYNDLVLKYDSVCHLIEEKVDLDMSLYGLAYYPHEDVDSFEKDDNHLRLLIDKLKLSYAVSDNVRGDLGKLRSKSGLFYLQSPASLMNNYYSGFKPSRIYDYSMKQAYSESFWGAVISKDTEKQSLSLSVSPKLTQIDKRYESSSNWSATERSNANERYMISYTDYRFGEHTPSMNLMLGDSKSVAFSNSYNYSPQFAINAELAYHFNQQWRHLETGKAEMVQHYAFPADLYTTSNDDGVELALGLQYTTDRFSQFGVEYYFQSEGYSAAEWRKQTDLIRFLNQEAKVALLDQAFDAYKYLMAAEISNTSNKGYFLGKHYLNTYASFLMNDQSSIQSFIVLNMRDKSSLLGITYNKPLEKLDKKLEMYTGVYTAFGNQDSEFGLFGETIGSYLGFKYHF